MNTQLPKDKMIQIILLAVVVVLAVVVIILVKREPQIPFILDGENAVTLDENALPTEEGDKAVTDTGAKTTTTTKTTTTASDSGITTPPPVAGSCKPTLSGKKVKDPSGISLYWNPCSSDDFQFYKLVKSATNPNPSYPNDPVVMSSSNHSVSNYLDKTVASPKTYYYTLCVIQRLGKIACSNKIAVNY